MCGGRDCKRDGAIRDPLHEAWGALGPGADLDVHVKLSHDAACKRLVDARQMSGNEERVCQQARESSAEKGSSKTQTCFDRLIVLFAPQLEFRSNQRIRKG